MKQVIYTLSRQKYLQTTKLTCTNCVICWLRVPRRRLKYANVLNMTCQHWLGWKFLIFCVFREVSRVSATWAISGTSTTMATTQLVKVQMLRKLKSRVARVWRFQICNQIIQIDSIFIDIRYSIVWINYEYINKFTPHGIPKIRNFHPSQCWHVIFNIFAYFNLLLVTQPST